MPPAAGTVNLDARHAVAVVDGRADGVLNRREEARPAASALELRFGPEQGLPAAGAVKGPGPLLGTAMRASERLDFGMVGVNEWTPQAVEAPFVGWKESGVGREAGSECLEEYMETKLVAIGGL